MRVEVAVPSLVPSCPLLSLVPGAGDDNLGDAFGCSRSRDCYLFRAPAPAPVLTCVSRAFAVRANGAKLRYAAAAIIADSKWLQVVTLRWPQRSRSSRAGSFGCDTRSPM